MAMPGTRIRESSAFVFSWWWGEMKDLLPGWLIGNGGVRHDRIVLQVEDGELVCLRCHGNHNNHNINELDRIAANDADPADQQAFVATLYSHMHDKAGTKLRLTENCIVRRRISLPAAALQNLRQVLAFEMDRHTPFQAADVYYDYRVLDKTDAGLTVELIAVPRDTLDGWVDKLAGMGIKLGSVDVLSAGENTHQICRDADINLLPDEQRPPPTDRALTPLNLGLAVVAGVLLVVVLAMPLFRMHDAVAGLQAQTDAARVRAEEVAELRDQLNNRIEEIRKLLNNKNGSPPVIELFAELARILPDDTWLRSTELKGGKFLIQGESAAASSLLGLIEASPIFGGASFVSPVTQNPATGRERFQISLQAGQG